jgi:hypothetical protein
MLPNIRNDIGKGRRTPPPLPTGPVPDVAGILFSCPECGRNHLVALECPPIGAPLIRGPGGVPVVSENYLPSAA